MIKFTYLVFILSAFILSCSKSTVLDSSNVSSMNVCLTTWGQVVPEGSKVIGYSSELARCNESCDSFEFECKNNKLTQVGGTGVTADQKVYPSCVKETKCSCKLPEGHGLISDGVTFGFYKKLTVNCGETCAPQKFDGLCVNGKLSETTAPDNPLIGSYFVGCTVNACASCPLPWDPNQSAIHGAETTGYIAENLSCSENCEASANKVPIKCNNGTWQKVVTSTATIQNLKKSCSLPPVCNCTSKDGVVYTHNQTLKFKLFTRDTGTCSNQCDLGIDFTCKDGSFLNSSNQATAANTVYSKCTETCVFCDLPFKTSDGTTAKLAINEYSTGYKKPAACNQFCDYDKGTMAQLKCSAEKVLSVNYGNGKPEDFTSATCPYEECKTCSVPWSTTETILNDAQTVRYKKATATCSESCESLKFTVKCSNSALQTIGPNLTSADVQNSVPSCSQSICLTCTLSGKSYNDGESVVAYKKNTVGCTETCADTGMYITRKCVGGVFTGDSTYNYSSCTSTCVNPNPEKPTTRTGDASTEGGGAAPSLCPVIGGRSFMYGGTQVTYYTKNRVCGESCNKYREVYTCNPLSGLLGDPAKTNSVGVSKQVFFSCKEECP